MSKTIYKTKLPIGKLHEWCSTLTYSLPYICYANRYLPILEFALQGKTVHGVVSTANELTWMPKYFPEEYKLKFNIKAPWNKYGMTGNLTEFKAEPILSIAKNILFEPFYFDAVVIDNWSFPFNMILGETFINNFGNIVFHVRTMQGYDKRTIVQCDLAKRPILCDKCQID